MVGRPELSLVLDCLEPDVLARFWTAALGYEIGERVGQYLVLVPSAGGRGPNLILQQVAETKVGKLRLHLDLRVEDPVAEVARLIGLGACGVAHVEELGLRWTTLADPEGNEFCVTEADPAPQAEP